MKEVKNKKYLPKCFGINSNLSRNLSHELGSLKVVKEPQGKPRVSLTAPYCDHFARVSLTVLGVFWGTIAKAKNEFANL